MAAKRIKIEFVTVNGTTFRREYHVADGVGIDETSEPGYKLTTGYEVVQGGGTTAGPLRIKLAHDGVFSMVSQVHVDQP